MASEFTLVGQGRSTYYASVRGLLAPASASDVFTLTGAPGRRITPLLFGASVTAGADTTCDILAIKRSSANTGGTFTVQAAVPAISTHAPAKAVIRAYTANPTTGTPVGEMMLKRMVVGSSTAATAILETILDFRADYCGPVELLSEQEVLAINLGGASISGSAFNIWGAWTEEYGS